MTTEERIEQLEMKIAFQDDNINTLNDEIFEQQRKLQLLSEQVAYLVTKLKDAKPDDGAIEEVDMRPPHY